MTDLVNSPPHYIGYGMEVIDVIEAFDLDFHRASAIKYILRAGKKDDAIQDIQKAIWFLNRYAKTINLSVPAVSLQST